MRVLLVDDEVEYVSTLAERLSFRGFEAQWVSSANEALESIGKNHFDIAVLDVKMPKMGGIELKKKIEEIAPGMKFIYLTGHGSEDDYNKGVTDGVYYLIKPVDIDQLITFMNQAMPNANS
ncbi:two-component sensory box histidine kinase/response regulator [Desulforapulum autotrophicum HRM2]|uniref:Two-component sensory box histidine kinase/response regulator n=1 Tax=Desulforapulum autotrophicum (strain ATCC 43914 / DSM 3382 / VKM B-1955 / HRM2) TaxID=177437 RepID=C0QC74_DESAH|nr:response regulator [Desulforapulum autotrophicum]ACN17091.1 two-component sensory box histidine kinase/response regulator [Desulforapulum autotrophicum HRM2]